MKITNVALGAAALAAAVVLSACGGPGDPGSASGQAPASAASAVPGAPASAEHNAADIAFAQGMIPHHRQAIEMATLAEGRAGSDDVRRLAAGIQQAQDPEITQMRGFLAAWGAPESTGMPGMPGMDHGGMAGMMSGEQMGQLMQASGVAFDRLFLQLMIAHHDGAIVMARAELADGTNPQAKALAQRIIDAQQAEIGEMRRLLA